VAACVLGASLGLSASSEGRIRGRVIDRTASAHPVVHQTVRLTIIERGASSDQEAVSDAAGRFQFAGLPVGGIRVFVLSTEYRGVRYASDRVVLAAAAPVQAVDLIVYESSSDRAAVRGTVALAVVDVARGAVRVSVVQGLSNPTDETVVVDPQDPLVFPLPPGAEAVNTLAGWRDPHIAAGRITDAFPLPPGVAQVAYTYGVEVKHSTLGLPWSLPYGAKDVEVLVADVGVNAAVDGLIAQGTVTGPKGRYRRYSGGPLLPGGRIVLRLRGMPLAGDPWPLAVAAGLGLTLAFGLAIALRRSRRVAV
jgi:hypothetical protein